MKVIDGETFIMAHVHIRIELHRGQPEVFPIKSQVNSRIVSHPNPNVRSAAHQLHKFDPNPSKLIWEKDNVRCEGYLNLGPNDQDVEYEFEMLETTDGMYYFNLRRFTEKVEFSLIKAPELEYEHMAFGGFPSLEPFKNGVLRAETWKTKNREPAMPNQGLILQWYPKKSRGSAPAGSRRRPAKVLQGKASGE